MVFIIIHAELIFLEMETETAGIIVAFLLLLFKWKDTQKKKRKKVPKSQANYTNKV